MAADELSSPKTLEHSDPSPSHSYDSTAQTESTDNGVSGEKRKREDQKQELLQEGDPVHPLWKTSLCSYFRRQDGSCTHGETCRYAHGEQELRRRPDNTWDPTSERAKKALKSHNGEKCDIPDEVMMTEAVADDGDGEAEGGGDGQGSNQGLSKCLVHLPKKWSSDNLRNFLNEQGIHFKFAKKKKGMMIGFVTFEDEQQLKASIKELEGKSIGTKNLKVAEVIPRSFEKKSNSTAAVPHDAQQKKEENAGFSPSSGIADKNTNEDTLAHDGSISKKKSARDVVTPLAHMAYHDQLEHKKNSLMQILKRLTRNARKACPNGVSLPEWILKSRDIGGLPCKLEGIIKSPLVNGYRNKCEFSVGYSLEGKITVGFMLGNFREGVTAVEEPLDCPNVSTIACIYASIFQEFLQHSELPVWNRFMNAGFWRQLTVREGRANQKSNNVEDFSGISEVMLIVQVCTGGFGDEPITSEFKRLAQAFALGASACFPHLPLTALVVQDHRGVSNVAPADVPLQQLPIPKAGCGSEPDESNNVSDPRINDYINDLQFCISPTAFFQVNTLAAEKLYSLAGDWACLSPDTLLFDICCGTGTIGLTLARHVGMVIGIEMNASAVSDAHQNAEINGIKNCRFVCARAEDVIGSLLKEYLNVPQKHSDTLQTSDNNESIVTVAGEAENSGQELSSELQKLDTSGNRSNNVQQFEDVVCIVDPPRAGLHPTVIKALRTHQRIRRLVYISCNPESLVANAIELCTPSPVKIEKGNKDNKGWRNMSSSGLARHRAKSMPNSEPFRPVRAMAVDLFPHTQHCEMVMLLER